MAANASESNSITSRNEPHFASALARGKAISLLRLIIFPVSFDVNVLITSARLTSCCQSTHLLWWKTAGKALGDRGTGARAKETNKLFWVWKVGGGRIEEHFLQFLEFCYSSLCYGFANFKLLVFLDHFKYGQTGDILKAVCIPGWARKRLSF